MNSRLIKTVYILFLMISLISCGKQKNRFQKIDISNSSIDSLRIVRFDQAIFSLDECITKPAKVGNYDLMTVDIPDNDFICLNEKIQSLQAQYGKRLNLYLYQLGAMTGSSQENPASLFYLFLSHPAYRDLYTDTENAYKDVTDLENQFLDAFKRASLLFPNFNIPEVYITFTGFAEYIAADENTLYVSLEYFLGKDYKNYLYVPGIYEYMIPNLIREKLVPDALYYWISSEYPMKKESPDLLDNMIYYGKMMYITESLLPNVSDSIIIGYSKEEIEWCDNNESNMWNYLREYNQLFSTDNKTIADYINHANCTKYFSDEKHKAPSRTGVWIGWQIVREFMDKNKEITLPELLTIDAQFILQNSRYNP